jgi:hypothetical protein
LRIEITDNKKNLTVIESDHDANIIIGDTSIGKSFVCSLVGTAVKIVFNGIELSRSQIFCVSDAEIYGEITLRDYSDPRRFRNRINELNVKLIILDDFGDSNDIPLIEEILNEDSSRSFIGIFRDYQIINTRFPVKKFKTHSNIIKLEDFISSAEIIQINNSSPTLNEYNLIVTEDKNKNNKAYSGYKLWKESLNTVIQFYDKSILGVRGTNSIYRLLDSLKNNETLTSQALIAVDLTVDNYNTLTSIKNILRYLAERQSKIISILTAEQHYILSNINSIMNFDNNLGEQVLYLIKSKQDVTSVVNLIEPYCITTSQKASLDKLKSKLTQEKKYKSLL